MQRVSLNACFSSPVWGKYKSASPSCFVFRNYNNIASLNLPHNIPGDLSSLFFVFLPFNYSQIHPPFFFMCFQHSMLLKSFCHHRFWPRTTNLESKGKEHQHKTPFFLSFFFFLHEQIVSKMWLIWNRQLKRMCMLLFFSDELLVFLTWFFFSHVPDLLSHCCASTWSGVLFHDLPFLFLTCCYFA